MAQTVAYPSRKKSAAEKWLTMLAATFFSFLLFLLFMTPFVLVVFNAAKTAGEISLNPVTLPTNWLQIGTNIHNVVNNPNFSYFSTFLDSVVITVSSLTVIVLFSAMAAWVLVRNKTGWSTFIFMVLVAAMVVPFQVVMLPLVQWLRIMGDFFGIKLNGTYGGIVLCYLGFGASMSVFIFHGFIKGIPLELEEAQAVHAG